MSRRLAVLLALSAVAQIPVPVSAQALGNSGAGGQSPAGPVHHSQAASPASRPAAGNARVREQNPANVAHPGELNPAPPAEDETPTVTNQQPQYIVTSPPAAASPWTWREQLAWGANIVLAVLGYVGIMLGLRTLKRIERHTEVGAATAQAAVDTASAALAQSQAIVSSERPWIVVSIEPFLTMENSFKLMAINRGRSPARIVSAMDQVTVAADDMHLPETPEYDAAKLNARPNPIILLPGESVAIKAFGRSDARLLCEDDKAFERIELWEDKIFLYGKVTYTDMISSADKQSHTTDWCYWYIHGEKDSALTIAGSPKYNQHT